MGKGRGAPFGRITTICFEFELGFERYYSAWQRDLPKSVVLFKLMCVFFAGNQKFRLKNLVMSFIIPSLTVCVAYGWYTYSYATFDVAIFLLVENLTLD